MNKKIQRIISGILSVMLVGQVMIYGDGSSQGIAHAETIKQIKDDITLSKNADELAQEFSEVTKGLGEVEYFSYPEANVMLMSENYEAEESKI